MGAGREMDRLIAEKIFGKQTRLMHAYRDSECGDWSVCPFCEMAEHGDPDVIACYRDKGREQEPCYAIPGPGTDVYWAVVPFYSQDIDAAWALVEYMQSTYGFMAINGFMLTKKDEGWYCEFPLPHWEDGEADTAPLAICRAALAAVGATVAAV